ncbi:MAG: OmpH family outer membrane protein [Acidobacteria bacterium]|nr:OmpH family outer membrane protein [Acidobacteriota bacterium]
MSALPVVLMALAVSQVPQPPAAPAPPATTTALEVAWIDIGRTIEATEEGKASLAKLQALQQVKTKELTAQAATLRELQAKHDALPPGADARSAMEREAARLRVELQRRQQDAEGELAALENELLRPLLTRIGEAVEALSRERGLRIVISAGDATYLSWVNPDADLTAAVSARINAAKPPK